MVDLCACCLRPVGLGSGLRSASLTAGPLEFGELFDAGAGASDHGIQSDKVCGCAEWPEPTADDCSCVAVEPSTACGCGGGCESGGTGAPAVDASKDRWADAIRSGFSPWDRGMMAMIAPEDCGDLCGIATDNIVDYRWCMLECLRVTGAEPGTGPDAGCPDDDEPYFSLPAFTSMNFATQSCLAFELGSAAWPDTDCCPPPVHATTDCEPPTVLEWLTMFLRVPNDGNSHADELINAGRASPATPTTSDYELFSAGMAVLVANIDIVRWVTCLVQQWSPDLTGMDVAGRLDELLTAGADGTFPLTVTYVGTALNPDGTPDGATMWAFNDWDPANDGSVGLIVPIGHSIWQGQVVVWDAGGPDAFCAAVQVATSILHELIHIAGDVAAVGDANGDPIFDQPGTLHETWNPFPCWDESRMVGTMFMWAMARRYLCLDSLAGCRCMSGDEYFGYSVSSLEQHYGRC